MNRKSLEQLAQAAPVVPLPPRPAPPLAFRPFPIESLPEPVASFVAICAKSIGCDPAFIAVPLIPALGSLIGNARRIRLKSGWDEPPVFWAILLGESGTMKTPGFRVAMNPLRILERDEMRAHKDRLADYEREELHYDKALKDWKNKGDGEPPEKPQRPQPARFIVSDTTVEALMQILDANWRGVLLARDELNGWISSFDRYVHTRGGDAAHWLSMHNAETVVYDRKTGPDRTIMVERAAVCIAGGIQPGTFRRAIGHQHRDNGLLARLLVTFPPRRVKRWTDAGIPPEIEARLGDLCDGLRAMQPEHFDDRIEPVIVRVAPDAHKRLTAFFNEHSEEQAKLSGDLCAAWSKLEAYTARFALLVHCIRVAAGDPTIASDEIVDDVSVVTAITLTKWFGHEARRVYGMLDEDEDGEARRHLVDLIERMGGTTTVREWQRRRSHRTAQDAVAELADLEAHGYGTLDDAPQSGPGRPSKVFTLYDTTDIDNTATPESESGVSSVSVMSGPRREVAHLLRTLRRMGHRDRAVDIRDEWRERLTIASVEAGLTEAEAQAVALSAVAAMSIGPTGLTNGWSMSQGASP